MKKFQLAQSLTWKESRYWLVGIIAGLEAICITLVWKANEVGLLGMSILFLLAASTLLWEKRHSLHFESGVFSSIVSLVLISWVLWESFNMATDKTLHLLPFASALGVSLLASGFKGLKQYWQELIVLFFSGVPSVVCSLLFDISPLTAQFAGFLLWCFGFDVSVVGTDINLLTGGVNVNHKCSGIDTITYILGISVVALVMFPIHRSKQLLVPIVAVIIGFVVNGVRVAMLTAMVASSEAAFNNWHGGKASYSYAMVGVLILGLFYSFLLRQEEMKNQDSRESQR